MSTLEGAREATIQLLCRHFALDHLSTESLDARLDLAQRAGSLEELRALTVGLPTIALSDSAYAALAPLGEARMLRDERRIVEMFSEKTYDDDWELARHTRVVATLAQLTLDLRGARIPAGTSTLEITATLAEVKVIVPPGIHVELDGTAILGSFERKKTQLPPTADPDAPMLRITGYATLSEVTVKTRLPDETALAALKREWR
jgi:hypothetical protein